MQLPPFIKQAAETLFSSPTNPAAQAINALGLELLPKLGAGGANTVFSPYSLQAALVMAFAGADGSTRSEMARALHYPVDTDRLHAAFASLRGALAEAVRASEDEAMDQQRWDGSADPVALAIANRLFGQLGFQFRPHFLALLAETHQAPLEALDFAAADASRRINQWVESQTGGRIADLVSPAALSRDSRLVLVNAIHFKASWSRPFGPELTRPLPFHPTPGDTVLVPTMQASLPLGHVRCKGYQALTIPYIGGELQFLVVLPDVQTSLSEVESRLTAEALAEAGRGKPVAVNLRLPKFRVEPPTASLRQELGSLGMRSAFDEPAGSADFSRMASRRPENYLALSEVLHRATLCVDEAGTEAAAATAVVMFPAGITSTRVEPIEFTVDRPFLFAIQHRTSGACLFLGHIHNPAGRVVKATLPL
jgi:serpin B